MTEQTASSKTAPEITVVLPADGTLRLSRLISAQLPTVQVISLDRADYGGALAAGLGAARGSVVATFDVDYYDFTFYDRALALIDQGADIVLASKRAPGSDDRRPIFRRLLTASFAMALSSGLGLSVSDTHGMKVMRLASVAPLVDQTVSRGSLFDVELVTRATRRGLRVDEIAVAVRELRPPRSSVLRRAAETLAGLVRLRVVLGPAAGPTTPGSGDAWANRMRTARAAASSTGSWAKSVAKRWWSLTADLRSRAVSRSGEHRSRRR